MKTIRLLLLSLIIAITLGWNVFAATISNSFTATGPGTSLSVKVGDSFTYSVSGTFSGTVVLQRSTNLFTWSTIATATGSTSGTVIAASDNANQVSYRFFCTDFVSGTIVTAMVEATMSPVQEFKNLNGVTVAYTTEKGLVVQDLTVTGTQTGGGGGGGGGTVSDDAYSASWDGVTDVAPSQNSLYDKIETLASGAAGWTDNGTSISLTTSSDNVGIGTNAPDSKLHVIGTLHTSAIDNPGIVLDALTTNETDFWVGVRNNADGTNNDRFQIGTGTTLGSNPILTILSNGNVGIGSTNPGAALDLGSGNGIGQWTTSGSNIYYNTGNVGIGTAVPSFVLDVRGASSAQIKAVNTTASSSSQGAALFLYSDDGAAMASGDQLGFLGFGGAQDASGTTVVGSLIQGLAAGVWSGSARGASIAFQVTPSGTTSRSEAMRLTDSGNLGIGTTTASGKLVVIGGNVGIGSTFPSFPLEVSATSSAQIKATYTGSSSSSLGAALFLGTDDGAAIGTGDQVGYIGFNGSQDASHNQRVSSIIAGVASENWSGSAVGSDIVFITNTNGGTTRTEKMRITNAGNVGIGTSAPTGFFSVGSTSQLKIDSSGIIQPAGYKSSDGTSGATVTTCTGFKNGLCISGT